MKIKSVSFNRTFEFNDKTYYEHSYEMEDGTQFNANHMKELPFNVGDDVDYEIVGQDKHGNNKGKVGKPKADAFSRDRGKSFSKEDPSRQRLIAAQSSVSSACQFYQERQASEETVLKFAEQIYNWVMSKQ